MVKEAMNIIANTDPEIARAIEAELTRQRDGLELIASENIVSEAVLFAMGSVLTNKYAEGYPAKRYYGGCECVDVVENIAIERAKKLFGANYANVQPHSGAQANTAVYFALLQPGDTVMGMSLAHGGHLTHGSPVNMSGMYFNFIPYELNAETERIDYDEFEKLAKQHKPKLIVAGASAYPRTIDFKRMAEVAHSVGAYFMVDMAHIAGLVAAGEHPSPVPYADVVTTTTHKTLRGPRGGMILTNDEELAKKADKTALAETDATLAALKKVVDDFFAEDAAVNDVIDTLKEITAYIANDKEGAADLTARVGALETKVDVEKVSEAITTAKEEAIDEAAKLDAVVLAEAQVYADNKVTELVNGDIAAIKEALTWGTF